MREIKFRAWSTIQESKMIYLKEGLLSDLQSIQNKWQVTQFTGLKDKNGVDIYEGDIVSKVGNNFYEYQVSFKDGSFVLQTKHYGYKILSEYVGLEVIGNIFENTKFNK